MTSQNLTPEPTVRYSKSRRKNKKTALRMDAYLRYSAKGDRDVEGDRFQSLREQRERIEEWARSREVEILAWHEDAGVSGGKMKRPGFDAMMARVRDRETDGVAVAMLDRFSRAKPSEAMDVVEELMTIGAALTALDIEGCDPTTSTGELVMLTMLNMSRFFRRQAGEKYSAARARAVRERHVYIAPSTPVGYLRVNRHGEPVGPNARAARLVEHPVEGPIVREFFKRRALGESWGSLRDWLQSTGIKPQAQRVKVPDGEGGMITVEGARPERWGVQMVKRLPGKRVYLGEVGDEHGGVYVDGAHPALTDRATFDAARTISRPRARPASQLRSPLQGLVYCAGCSYKMGLQSPSAGTKYATFFYCNRYRNAKDCPAPAAITIKSDRRARVNGRYTSGQDPNGPIDSWGLVDYVTEAMLARVPDLSADAFGKDDRLPELRSELEQAKALFDEHYDDDERRTKHRDAWDRKAARLQATVDGLQAEIARAELTATRPLVASAEDLRAAIGGSMADHHSALTSAVNGVFVRATGRGRRGASVERVHIVWFDGEMPPVPRHGPHGGDGFPRSFVFPNANDPADVGVVAL